MALRNIWTCRRYFNRVGIAQFEITRQVRDVAVIRRGLRYTEQSGYALTGEDLGCRGPAFLGLITRLDAPTSSPSLEATIGGVGADLLHCAAEKAIADDDAAIWSSWPADAGAILFNDRNPVILATLVIVYRRAKTVEVVDAAATVEFHRPAASRNISP